MSIRQNNKKVSNDTVEVVPVKEVVKETPTKKNKKDKKEADMNTTNEQMVNEAEAITNGMSGVKLVKKERGLIERTESSKIILTEDNRQVLTD
jgi:hypothetical protein